MAPEIGELVGATMVVELRQATNRGQVIGRPFQDVLKLRSSFVVLTQIQECPSERDASRQMLWKLLQAVTAKSDRALQLSRPAKPLGDGAERRGVLCRRLSRAMGQSQGHSYLTWTVFVVTPLRPVLSVTVSVTV